ncbi:copper resistance D family protein [Litorimonas haliclonae]|uniref:copper resistance D family protein n=1 Tax=Litorimonas haliclonae TaxID=2081977 RepID=UPI0039F043DB
MLTALALIAKLMLYIGALVSIGILSHFCLGIQQKLKRLRTFVAVLILGAILKLIIANGQLAGSLSQAFNQQTFGWVWQSNGTQFLVFVGGAGLAILSSFIKPSDLRKITTAFSIILLSAGFAASGHTQAAENMPFLPLWVIPHILIAGYWLYAPFSLWPADTLSDRDLILRTERFSHFAIWAVPFLFVTGLYLLWRLNGNLLDIGSTLYERFLMVKLVAALILLGAGAFNKFRIGILLQQSPLVGRAALRKSLGLEAVLFLFVLLCVLWATTVTGPNGHSH